ncbi:MAG: ATPase [Leptospiraceae bacterium]|nr:ATPase [Leptospiraceae bacterium]
MERFKVEATISGSKVIYERYFDVIPELVFKAWASPEELSQWWGPDGFSLTTVSMEFRDGGLWDFVMHGPDGTDYKNRVKFLEILEPSRIVYQHMGDGEENEDVEFATTVTFEREGPGTRLTMEQEFGTEDELRRVNDKYGAIEGGKQHIENLSRHLKSRMAAG